MEKDWDNFRLLHFFCATRLNCTIFFYPSSSGSSDRHPAHPGLRPALSLLAAPTRLGTSLALLRGVPAQGRGPRRCIQRWVQGRLGSSQVGLAETGRSERNQRRDRQAGDGQCVRAAGQGLQQGRLRGVQRGGVSAHSPCTRWDESAPHWHRTRWTLARRNSTWHHRTCHYRNSVSIMASL